MDTVFRKGKYKGKTVLEVIQNNLNYILWCIEHISDFTVKDETFYEIIELSRLMGSTYVNHEREKYLKDILNRRFAEYEWQISKGNTFNDEDHFPYLDGFEGDSSNCWNVD